MKCAQCGSTQQAAMCSNGVMLCFGCYDDEAREERAAIMEYDGGLSRDEAERLAGYGSAKSTGIV